MRNLCLSIFFTLTLFMMLACNQKPQNTAVENTDSISSTDSLNAVKDSSAKANVPTDKGDAKFVAEAIKACMVQSELGKLALHNAQNKRVKNFGVIMIKDINKANKKLIILAKNKHITLPTTPDINQQKAIDSLAKKSGSDFDKTYVNAMITDHNNYINIFESASKNSTDPEIKSFANKALRIIKNHLEAIHTINDSMK